MIVVFVKKDIDILEAGYSDAQYKPATFGIAYSYVPRLWPVTTLGRTENLFITAHGDKDSIGDAGPTLEITASELAGIIKQVVPGVYTGNIYISTCNSYKIAQEVKRTLGSAVGTVYGTQKSIDYAIEGPSGSNWKAA
jgi:hypothetical protein